MIGAGMGNRTVILKAEVGRGELVDCSCGGGGLSCLRFTLVLILLRSTTIVAVMSCGSSMIGYVWHIWCSSSWMHIGSVGIPVDPRGVGGRTRCVLLWHILVVGKVELRNSIFIKPSSIACELEE